MAATTDANPRGAEAVTTSSIMVALATVFAILRIYSRVVLVKKPGIDDLLLLCALVFSVVIAVLIKAQEQHGLGRHFATLAPGEYAKMLLPFWASIIVYNLGLAFVKCSILCQFFRFFIDQTARLTCWIALVVVITYCLCTTLGSIFACTPVAYFWDRSIPNGHCINLLAFWFSNASFNILSDLVIIILPIPVLKSLSIPRKQKYGLIMIFIMGGFGCITSILRLHSVYNVSQSKDVTYDNAGAATWSSIELNVGIICACLVTLKPILGAVFPCLGFNNSGRNYSVELPASDIQNIHRAAQDNRSTDIERAMPPPNRHSLNQKTPWEEVEEVEGAWDFEVE